MNKTIINSIDVSECPLYDKNTGCYHTFNGECVQDSCAVYKWLLEYKRLQEENEELNIEKVKLENKLQLRMASDKESDEYWDDIFSQKDYPFNKENVYKELSDYYFVLNQLPTIYMEITGGRLSKTTYFASSVIEAYNDAIQDYWNKIDDFETKIYNFKQTLEKIREKLKKYDANIGDTIIANPIQDCYDTYKLIDEVLNDRD